MSQKIYAGQFDVAWEDKAENYRRVRALLRRRNLAAGSLLVLPELFATGFTMNAEAAGEPAGGPTDNFLRDLAREKEIYVIGGLARSVAGGQVHNEALCLDRAGRTVAKYSKIHLFSPGEESRHYAPGAAVRLFRWAKFTVAVFICYDLRFPEIFRLAAQRGANLLVVIASWPAKRQEHWTALLRARAIENQAYVIGVNRCGCDPNVEYRGGSLVADPWGEPVAQAGQTAKLLSADLDFDRLARVRSGFPVLRDMRARIAVSKRGQPA